MQKSKTYLPVNWVDGMKINKTHFVAERNALQQQIVLSGGSHISDINYGLLPMVAQEHEAFNVSISLDNQQYVQVRLVNCRAITPGGAFININDGSFTDDDTAAKIPDLSVPYEDLKTKSTVFFVVLSVNIYDRVGAGNAEENEIPPRLPHAVPQYNLSLLPEEELNEKKPWMYQLTLSKILLQDGKLEVDESYIPPCTSASSHTELTDIYYGLEEFMSKMELYSVQINQKIQQKKQTNDLAIIVQRVCDNIIQYQTTHLTHLKWMALHEMPAVMLSHPAAMARLIKNTLDIYVNSGKEELMNYFAEWCDVNQAKLETVITDLCNHKYLHEDINAGVVRVEEFTKIISSLFYKLSKLDYIGKKRDANIFVKEEIVDENTAESNLKKRRSFLAD
jgi:hypothetical protein